MITLPIPADSLQDATDGTTAAPEDVREWLSVLTLSTTILQKHGNRLPGQERRAQWEMMHEAGARLVEALSVSASARR